MPRKYFWNEQFFSKIDSKEKAYWLGFMYADGYISKNNVVGICLKKDDRQHLLNFLSSIGLVNYEPKYDYKTKSYRVCLCSKQMVNDLINIGFSTQKSYDQTSAVFDNVDNKYKKDFLLGFWDGDGSFSITPKGKLKLASVVSNNSTLIQAFVRYINENIGQDFCKIIRFRTERCSRIRLKGNNPITFGMWLYQDSVECKLVRKYEAFLSMEWGTKSHIGEHNPKSKKIRCLESGKTYVNSRECCEQEFGCKNISLQNAMRLCCRGKRKTVDGKHFEYVKQEEEQEIFYGQSNL